MGIYSVSLAFPLLFFPFSASLKKPTTELNLFIYFIEVAGGGERLTSMIKDVRSIGSLCTKLASIQLFSHFSQAILARSFALPKP